MHERELVQLCAEQVLRRQLSDSCCVQLAQSAIAACSDRNAQRLVDAITESNLKEAYQRALQEFQKFDDRRKRAITLMETLEATAATAGFAELRQIFQLSSARRTLETCGTLCGVVADVSHSGIQFCWTF